HRRPLVALALPDQGAGPAAEELEVVPADGGCRLPREILQQAVVAAAYPDERGDAVHALAEPQPVLDLLAGLHLGERVVPPAVVEPHQRPAEMEERGEGTPGALVPLHSHDEALVGLYQPVGLQEVEA